MRCCSSTAWRLILLFVAAAATSACARSSPGAKIQKWAGNLTFPPYATDEALNITINTATSTADVAWIFDKSGAGVLCEAHVELGLKMSILPNTSTVHLVGTGKDPKFYSFTLNLSADGRTFAGTIDGHAASRLEVSLDAPQVPSTCRGAPTPAPSKPQLPVWPQPSSWMTGTGVQELDAQQFVFSYMAHPTTSAPTPDTLAQAFHRYLALMTPHRPSSTATRMDAAGALRSLMVSVADASEDPPQQGTNESYELKVPGGGAPATLKAATVYGALRGLETFSQLVLFNFSASMYSVAGVPLTVVDAPRFTHRGLMVDTSRHFLTKAMLYQLLDSMSYAKLNVLHWHIVDDQSFPMEVNSYPKLQAMGAYSAWERYSRMDASDVVEYARLRGIRVMLEIDTPSHTSCWCRGYPHVCPPNHCGIRTPLDPSKNDTFTMIQKVLEELTPLFPETLLHVGQDEVDVGCWSEATNPTIGAWQKKHGFATPDEAYVYTANRIEVGVRSLPTPKRAVQWWPGLCLGESTGNRSCGKPTGFCPCRGVINGDGSPPQPGLDSSTVLQLWEGNFEAMAYNPGRLDWNITLPQVVKSGFAVIQSQGWYLNAEQLKTPWSTFYMNEPMAGVTKESEQRLILGGEACMWQEYIDGSNVLNTVWPRAAAVAERLWSPRGVNDTRAAKPRLAQFRFLLQARGIPAGVLDFTRPSSFGLPEAGQPPNGPGSCLDQ